MYLKLTPEIWRCFYHLTDRNFKIIATRARIPLSYFVFNFLSPWRDWILLTLAGCLREDHWIPTFYIMTFLVWNFGGSFNKPVCEDFIEKSQIYKFSGRLELVFPSFISHILINFFKARNRFSKILIPIIGVKMILRIEWKIMQLIHWHSFAQDLFCGLGSSQRPPVSVGVDLTLCQINKRLPFIAIFQ